MLLGDLGADVIKVERPGTGDETRSWGPPFDANGDSAYYLSVNRNKLSVALNLELPADREVLARLIAVADVVIDNFLPGVLSQHGLGPDVLVGQHPALIWCTISGFGPESGRPGYDFVVQAESGWMTITGEAAGDPMKTGVAFADVIAGKDAAIAILAALVRRGAATGDIPAETRRLHVSLWQSAMAALYNVAQNVIVSGQDATRWGNAHPNLVPWQLFRAQDRSLVLAVGSDGQWRAACRALGLEALASDAALDTNAGRVAHRQRVVSAIADRIAEHTAVHWLGALQAERVPCGVVRSVQEALKDVAASAITGIPPAPPGRVWCPPPRLDQHGPLLRAHGWDAFRQLDPERARGA